MNQWWTDPVLRGVYTDQAAEPPPPQHRNANDVASRLARVEEHLHFRAWDQRRVEQEGRFRDRDIVHAMMAMDTRVGFIEQEALTLRQARQQMQNLRSLAVQWVRYGIAALLGVLMLSGKANPEHVKTLLGLLGFPTG